MLLAATPSQRRRLRVRAVPLLAVLLLLLASPTYGIAGLGRGGPSLELAAPDSASVRTTSSVPGNFSYCAPFGANPAAIADLPNYTANVSAVWSGLCNRSVYIAAINEWGGVRLMNSGNNTSQWVAANLSIQVSGMTGGIPSIYFVVQWGAPCNNLSVAPASTACSYREYWIGNLSINELTGPFTSERIAICACGLSAAPTPFPLVWVVVPALAGVAALLGVFIVLRRRRPPTQRRSAPL
jgi:hypothetical protein